MTAIRLRLSPGWTTGAGATTGWTGGGGEGGGGAGGTVMVTVTVTGGCGTGAVVVRWPLDRTRAATTPTTKIATTAAMASR